METLDAMAVIDCLKAQANVSADSLSQFADWALGRDIEADGLEEQVAKLKAEIAAHKAHIAKLERDALNHYPRHTTVADWG